MKKMTTPRRTPIARAAVLGGAAMLVLAVCGATWASRAHAAPARQESETFVYLPFAWRPAPKPTPTAVPPTATIPAATATPQPVKPIDAEESDPRLVFTGDWQIVADDAASGGAFARTSTEGDRKSVV